MGTEKIMFPELWLPSNLEEARDIAIRVTPHFGWAAGTTLLRTQWEMGTAPMPRHLISLGQIPDLDTFLEESDRFRIGAFSKLKACADNEVVRNVFPLIGQAIDQISAPSIRNLATLGGNVASGVGDSIPALLVYGGSLQWMTEAGLIEKGLADWLEEWRLGKRDAHEFLTGIYVQIPDSESVANGRMIYFYRKIGRREAFTPSLVTIAFHGKLSKSGEWISLAMAAGGGSGTAMRLTHSENFVRRYPAKELSLTKLTEQIQAEFVTYSDAFASETYRKQTAANLFASELWKELR
ncbi:FAD binding domain-containing protein [Paenibacillus sp. Marseille-Q4541]|uniref:FAD binding domain-containing protein n=1 Tax=Paenibacillus sp. Marseille-Q4541 TaxID=2831522 RepID=UPI001BA9FE69|nr:FAD binding domain-containing protein [Paenibacillus sp. Marseille-Q4541]